MTDLLCDLRDYTSHLVSEFDIDAVTLQVCDRTSERHRVTQLLDLKVPSEASWTYQSRRVYAEDPFTDVELNEAPDIIHTDQPISCMDTRIQSRRGQCGSYWSFLAHYHMSVEGVSTRRLRRGVFTVAGFLRDSRRSAGRPLVLEALGRASTVLHNIMGAEVLRGTLQSNAGLMGLQRLLDRPDPEPAADPTQPLSRREMQVATLVARGRQTKEVAYQLDLSEHTVENHLRRIYGKLGIHSRTALAHLMG